MSLVTPAKVEKLRMALHVKAKEEPEFRFYQHYGTRPSKKSIRKLTTKVSELTAPRRSLLEAEVVVGQLNLGVAKNCGPEPLRCFYSSI